MIIQGELKMKKHVIILLLIFIFILSFNIIAQDFELKEDDLDIETNIVLLSFYTNEEVVKSNYFFEILYFQEDDYILIPINLLSQSIDLEVIFDRLSSIIAVKNPNNDKQIKVDIRDRTYINFPEWNQEPPVIYENDFFVSEKAIMYLLDAEVNWLPNYQEVEIRGEFGEEKAVEEGIIDEAIKEEIIKEREEEILKNKRTFSLGSINYKLEFDYRKRNVYSDGLSLKEIVSIFGRAGDWAISLREEGRLDLINKENELSLPFIKAKYQDENKLIILGDTNFNFENTIGKKNLRGLYFRSPTQLNLNLVPTIDISGETVPNSSVELIVNQRSPLNYQVKEDGKYIFEDIRLELKILNRLKLTITKPDGSIEIIDKKVTAVEKLLNKGTKEFEALGGIYKNNINDVFNGRIAGLRGALAVNEDLSVHGEGSYYDTDYLEDYEAFISSNIGLAYRLMDNTVVSFDWYYGDYNGEQESGYTANIHYAYNKGYIDGYYFYISENLSKLVDENSGKEQRIMAVYNLNDKWAIEPTVGTYESLDPDNPLKSKFIRLKLKNTNGWGYYLALLGSYEQIDTDYMVTLGNMNYLLPGTNNRYGAGIEYRQFREKYKLDTEVSFYNNTVNLPENLELNYNDIDYSIDFYQIITNDLLFTGDIRNEYQQDESRIYNRDEEIRLRLRYYLSDQTSFTLAAKDLYMDSTNYEERIYSALLNSYISDNISLQGKYSIVDSSNFLEYTELEVNASYNFNNNGYINIFANYIKPEEELLNTQISYGAGYNYLFDDMREIEVTAGKNYESPLSSVYEYYFTISYSHALSYSDKGVLNSRFNKNSHNSYVAGYVYLDENDNGKFDQNEETIPDIEMRLDNLTTTTNDKGLFRFDPMFADNYILNFNYRNLSADYTPITEEKLVVLRENENIFENFGLTLNGSIKGKVFLDKNNNGIEDEGDEPLSWIGITLGDNKYDYTDIRGEFYFENVSLGTHVIKIIDESIPTSLDIQGNSEITINISKEQLDIDNLKIPFIYGF